MNLILSANALSISLLLIYIYDLSPRELVFHRNLLRKSYMDNFLNSHYISKSISSDSYYLLNFNLIILTSICYCFSHSIDSARSNSKVQKQNSNSGPQIYVFKQYTTEPFSRVKIPLKAFS